MDIKIGHTISEIEQILCCVWLHGVALGNILVAFAPDKATAAKSTKKERQIVPRINW